MTTGGFSVKSFGSISKSAQQSVPHMDLLLISQSLFWSQLSGLKQHANLPIVIYDVVRPRECQGMNVIGQIKRGIVLQSLPQQLLELYQQKTLS
ncbi:hypothetical protein [Neptunicella marina]|uniref:Uncharacterized protein n=1 Tax=Neptunicella marina TaxID=2125989 RepID=A0A8J6IVJ3_9ALTE|nr:hypothetical protein [Neptunicella marina]MBC3766542.1 hypothetical protein [Neptunicella marina]